MTASYLNWYFNGRLSVNLTIIGNYYISLSSQSYNIVLKNCLDLHVEYILKSGINLIYTNNNKTPNYYMHMALYRVRDVFISEQISEILQSHLLRRSHSYVTVKYQS